MKILIVTQYFWPENFRVNDLALGLSERGHQVTVFTGLPNYPQGNFFENYSFRGPYHETFADCVEVVRIPLIPRGSEKGWQLFLNYISFALLGSLLIGLRCRGKFDKILIYGLSPVTLAFPAIVYKFIKKIPTFFLITDLWPDSLVATGTVRSPFILSLVSKMVRYIYSNCDSILVSSPGFIGRIEQQKTPREKIIFWPQWAESIFTKREFTDEDLPRSQIPDGFIIIFAGNIGTSQSFETIVEAAKILRDNDKLHWVILGDGLMKKWVMEQIKLFDLSQTFHLLGSRPLSDMPKYFILADALLVTLKSDPLFSITIPAKIQSYLASGRPIIAALDGEGRRIVEEAECGIGCSAGDAQELAKVVTTMYHLDQKTRNLMGVRAKRCFEENFERERLLSRLESILNKS